MPHAQQFLGGNSGDSIGELNPLDDASWDRRLASVPDASFFHGSAWARVLNETYGFTPVYLANGGSGTLKSLLPMMEVYSPFTGKRAISLPFTDECPPFCPDLASFQGLFHAATQNAESRGWNYIECRGASHLMPGVKASTSFFGHDLNFQPDAAAQFAGFSAATRRAIRKAEQSKLAVEFSHTSEAIDIFYSLLGKTRKRHGLPPQPRSFFANIHRHILSPKKGVVVIARLENVPVAAAIFFHCGVTTLFKFAASDESFHQLRVNNFVMWNAIKWHIAMGFRSMDFGRTSLFNEGLRRFKLGWGTDERKIEYFKYDVATKGFVTARDESSGWYNRVFRMMPISLSKLAGSALYKHAA